MAQRDEIEKDQYAKINGLTSKVEQLTGAVDVANQINLELMKLLKKARDKSSSQEFKELYQRTLDMWKAEVK